MRTVNFGKTLCGALAVACIAVGAACQRGAASVQTNSNARKAPPSSPASATSGTPTTMSEGKFEGISDQGDFNEALKNAIDAAHEGLKVWKVEWRLEELSGVHGGYTPPRNRITVKIHARPGSPG